MRRNVLGVAGIGLVAVTGCATPPSASTSAPASTTDGAAVVEEIVDGDTVVVRIAGRTVTVRLIGIDTPETKKPGTPVQCYGPEATARTTDLLPVGTPVRLERDVEARDTYDRLLAYVFRDDGVFVNLELVLGGFARTLLIEPNDAYAPRFADAARTAATEDRGLWGVCSG
jgi:micrococcal nuclease